jgi:hypothetical protein
MTKTFSVLAAKGIKTSLEVNTSTADVDGNQLLAQNEALRRNLVNIAVMLRGPDARLSTLEERLFSI